MEVGNWLQSTYNHQSFRRSAKEIIAQAGILNWKTETGVSIPAESIRIHENYNPLMAVQSSRTGLRAETLEYDIAILIMKDKFQFSRRIAPICLPASTSNLYTGQIGSITGWGGAYIFDNSIKSDELKEAKVKVWATDDCTRAYRRGCPEAYSIYCPPGDQKCIEYECTETRWLMNRYM